MVAVKDYIMRTCTPKHTSVPKAGSCVDDAIAGMPRSHTCYCNTDKCNQLEPDRLPSGSRVIHPPPLLVATVAIGLVLIDWRCRCLSP